MKRYFSLAFLLLGILLSIASCAPIFRFGWDSLSGDTASAPSSSFLTILMILAFALLLTTIGILMIVKSDVTPPRPGAPSPRNALTLLHAGPLLMYFGIPMAQLLIPFWIWSKTRGHSDLRPAANRALNFHITWSLYMVVALLLSPIVIGLPLIPLLLAFHLYVTLTGLHRAARGKAISYPLCPAIIPIPEQDDAPDSGRATDRS